MKTKVSLSRAVEKVKSVQTSLEKELKKIREEKEKAQQGETVPKEEK